MDKPVSPTGQPLFKPEWVKLALALYASLVALGEMLPEHTVGAKALKIGLLILGPLLGMVSPGLRSPAPEQPKGIVGVVKVDDEQ